MSDLDHHLEDDLGALAGASASEDGSGLPMVLWLRGDEPLCEEFKLDAEAVMAQLNIKRSRLTQISGRELRVARMRKGRYVSPVYRQADVDAYREWTRPTASHLKSSTVLKDAAASLSRQKDELSEQMETGFHATIDSIEQSIRRHAAESARGLAEEATGLQVALGATEAALHEGLGLVRSRVDALGGRLDGTAAQIEKLAALHALLARDLAETAALVRIQREDAETQAARVETALANLGTLMDKIARDVEAAATPKKPKRAPRKHRLRKRAAGAEAVKPLESSLKETSLARRRQIARARR